MLFIEAKTNGCGALSKISSNRSFTADDRNKEGVIASAFMHDLLAKVFLKIFGLENSQNSFNFIFYLCSRSCSPRREQTPPKPKKPVSSREHISNSLPHPH